MIADSENIWKYITIPKDPKACWIWIGRLSPEGYDKFSFINHEYLAHRFVYEYLVGQIPKELQIDHLCRNKACVNPHHLEPVTSKININRGKGNPNKYKIKCKNGHPFNKNNIYYQIENGYVKRKCVQCRKDAKTRFRKKEKLMVLNG